MEPGGQRAVTRWRAAALLAAGLAVGVATAAAPAAPSALWGNHRLEGHPRPPAYAFVRTTVDAELVPGRSRGFGSVRHVGRGQYCLAPSGVDVSGRAAVAAPEWTYTSGLDRDVAVFVDYGTPLCANAEVGIETTRSGAPDDGIAFTVVVP